MRRKALDSEKTYLVNIGCSFNVGSVEGSFHCTVYINQFKFYVILLLLLFVFFNS